MPINVRDTHDKVRKFDMDEIQITKEGTLMLVEHSKVAMNGGQHAARVRHMFAPGSWREAWVVDRNEDTAIDLSEITESRRKRE